MASASLAYPRYPRSRRIPRSLRSDEGMFEFLKTWVLIFILFIVVQANGLFSVSDFASSVDTVSPNLDHNPVLALLNGFLWLLSFVVMLPRLGSTFRSLRQQKTLLYILLLAVGSTLWSSTPEVSIRRSMLLGLAMLIGVYLASQFTSAFQMWLVLATGFTVALASLAMALLLPRYGVSYSGEWKGIFWHKNQLAQGMELLFAPLLFLPFPGGLKRIFAVLCALLAVALMVLSQARTAAILALVTIGVALLGKALRRFDRSAHKIILFVAIATVVLLVTLILTSFDTIVLSLGKDPSLTGRTRTWAVLVPFVFRHFWLGYGYQGFWTGSYGDSGTALSGINGRMVTADNGYIDFALQFGLVGMVLLLALVVSATQDFVRILRSGRTPAATFWYMAYVVEAVLSNLSGSFFFVPNGETTVLLALACVGLRRQRLYGEDADGQLS